MRKYRSLILALTFLASTAICANAGALFYAAIPATQSDANSGISTQSGYTSAVDGGNASGADRVINGVTLYALTANGQSSTADNCTLNALSGTLANGGGKAASIQADGTFGEVLSDMTFNNGATDNSQQAIVLEPNSLEAGATYDLRVYICNSSGQNRQVNLAFVGDGQAAVETGWFNEDDARTSAGGFKDANQVYCITYRYTWDGQSTPGVTITQKFGSAPFCLYALTNQLVAAGTAEAAPADKGADVGLVNETSDEVGVSSDDFYNSESLKRNGRWVELEKWGKCWQPSSVPNGWCPYTNGSWKQCDDCGWTFVSEEPWAWCCYHYGRWAKVRTGCGWAWVPGKVWAASWVSWRQGRDESCSCIGWAPLPPQASCELNVGISTWVDHTCDIGPEYYSFVNVRDFGSDSYFGCGCIYEHSRNVTIIIETANITNIYFNRNVTYCGGPDFNWCNERIHKFGGKEVTKIFVNRVDNPGKIKGGKFSHFEGNQLALLSPHVKGDKNPKHAPKVAEHLGADKIDKGWSNVKDKKLEAQLKNHIAEESKGKDPRSTKANLPPDIADKIAKQHGGKGNIGGTTQPLTTGGQANATFDQHPGGKAKGKNNGQLGSVGTNSLTPAGTNISAPHNLHPGGKKNGIDAIGGSNTKTTGTQTGGPNDNKHPGQLHNKLPTPDGGGPGVTGASTQGTGTTNSSPVDGKRASQHHGKPSSQINPSATISSATTTQSGNSQGGTGKGHHKQQTPSSQTQLMQNQGSGQIGSASGVKGQGQSLHQQPVQLNQQPPPTLQQGAKNKRGTPTPTPTPH